jgi:hypothetical protein
MGQRLSECSHQFVEEKFEAVLSDEQGQQIRMRRLDGEQEAHLRP